MRGYSTISDEERNSILQQHSSFYNGYSVGNVPNEPQPLRVDNGASDPNGVTVDNKGNVKTYQNHKINESKVKRDLKGFDKPEHFDDGSDRDKGGRGTVKRFPLNTPIETNEIEADDMDISDEESAFAFKSGGPDQFDSSYSDESYGMDIDSIMKMFGGDMSPAEYEGMDDMMNSDMDGKEMFHNEEPAYDFESEGGDAAVYYEEEQCEGCGDDKTMEEVDEDLQESFIENKNQIKEMFNRFSKFN